MKPETQTQRNINDFDQSGLSGVNKQASQALPAPASDAQLLKRSPTSHQRK